MDTLELIFLIVLGALCLIGLVAFIMAIRRSKAARIILCVFYALIDATVLTFALVWMGKINVPELIKLKDTLVPLVALALAIASSMEMGCLIAIRERDFKPHVVEKAVDIIDYAFPNNVRKAGVRLHGDYKVIRR